MIFEKDRTKILVSYGYGAGWSSWASGSREQIEFMLTYPGFIAALESKDTPAITDDEIRSISEVLKSHGLNLTWFKGDLEDIGAKRPAILRELPGFFTEWKKRWPGKPTPYIGGLCGLAVETVYSLEDVHIKHHDGYERISYCPCDDDY